ncbi:putative protein TPRXL [Homarus americanus]|uniref:putative protein TPRXL n=1 Tax=Homarus americanus TaxID=6706 RepID=UPI001C46460B|nr:putative protein TPRXL [Homarus americanus]
MTSSTFVCSTVTENWIVEMSKTGYQGVSKARTLVSGSIDQVKAGERALHALSHAHLHDDYHAHTSLSPTDSPPTSTKNLDATCRTDSGLYSEDSERDDDPKTPDRSSDHISASEDDLWTPRRPSGGDSTKDFKHLIRGGTGDSSSSSSPKSHFSLSPQPDNFTSELMIIEEGDLPQWKGSPSKEGDLTRWRGSSTKNSDLSKWNGASLSDTFISTSSSTAIIEGLEREVLWLQYTLDQAEKECEENISNLKLVEMETQLGDVKGEVGGQRDKFNSLSVEHDRVSPLNSFVSSSSSSSSSSASNSYQTPSSSSSSSLLQKTASRGLNHPSRILPHSPECLEATLG